MSSELQSIVSADWTADVTDDGLLYDGFPLTMDAFFSFPFRPKTNGMEEAERMEGRGRSWDEEDRKSCDDEAAASLSSKEG